MCRYRRFLCFVLSLCLCCLILFTDLLGVSAAVAPKSPELVTSGNFWIDTAGARSFTPSGRDNNFFYGPTSTITYDQTVMRYSYSGYLSFPVTVNLGSSGFYFGKFKFSYNLRTVLRNGLFEGDSDNTFYYEFASPQVTSPYDDIFLSASFAAMGGASGGVGVLPNEIGTVDETIDLSVSIDNKTVAIKQDGLFYSYAFDVRIPFVISCDDIGALSNGAGSDAHYFQLTTKIDGDVNTPLNNMYLMRYGAGDTIGLSPENYYFNEALQGGMDDVGSQISGSIDSAKEQAHQDAQQAHQDAEQAHQDSKNIFDKISDFFGSFFQNIINAVKSLFIPSGDELSGFMDDMKTFLTDKLGFLAYPFEILVKLVDLVANTGTSTLTLPGFSIMGHTVWDDITYNLSDGLSPFSTLLDAIKVGTSVIIVGAFLMYCQRKFNEVLGGASE